MNEPLAVTTLRVVLALVVGAYSVALIVTELRGHPHHALLLLGIVEVAGAILLLIPKTARIGGITLIAVFGLAALFHALHGEMYTIGYLAVDAASAFAVIPRRSHP
jgi:uncharacterized membrane protein